MVIKTGVDVLKTKRFLESAERGGDVFLKKIYTDYELRQNKGEQLASIFCVKEAIIKTMDLPPGSWLEINTKRNRRGKVECSFTNSEIARKVMALDTSVSHDGGLIIATAVAILKN